VISLIECSTYRDVNVGQSSP